MAPAMTLIAPLAASRSRTWQETSFAPAKLSAMNRLPRGSIATWLTCPQRFPTRPSSERSTSTTSWEGACAARTCPPAGASRRAATSAKQQRTVPSRRPAPCFVIASIETRRQPRWLRWRYDVWRFTVPGHASLAWLDYGDFCKPGQGVRAGDGETVTVPGQLIGPERPAPAPSARCPSWHPAAGKSSALPPAAPVPALARP